MLTSKILKEIQTIDDYSHLLLKDIKVIVTDRQYKVVKLKKQGYKNIEVAKKLGVSSATITKEMKIIKKELKRYLVK